MATETIIPFVFWGGDPIATLAVAPKFFPEDRPLLEQWADFFAKPATAGPKWLEYQATGRTWVDIPSKDGKRRLFLKPFYVLRSGERPLWYFAGFASEVKDAATWAGLLPRLASITRKEVEAAGTHLRLESQAITKSDEPLAGKIFTGNYESALKRLCEAVAAILTEELSQLHTASHPPAEHPLVTTLILSDGFCYPGIRVLAPPNPKRADRSEPKSNLGHRLPWIISILLLLALLRQIGIQSPLLKELAEARSKLSEEKASRIEFEKRSNLEIQRRDAEISRLTAEIDKRTINTKPPEKESDSQ